jgi:peptidoglycan/LPS O-acetylase OafA/YrhL
MTAIPTQSTNRYAPLDGLRGIACFMVFLYHLRWHVKPDATAPLELRVGNANFERLLANFDAGVAVFFVLSGLLLSLPFWRSILENRPSPNIQHYLWRRACRIVPAYFAVLFVVYLLRPGTYTLFGGVDFLLHLTFLHPFSDSSYYGVYPLLWTIGIEAQFYLLLPIIMAGVGRLYHRGGAGPSLSILILFTLLLDLAARSALTALAPHVSDRFLADEQSAVATGTIASYLKLFAFGIAAGLGVLRLRLSARAAEIGALLAGIGFLVITSLSTEAAWRTISWTGWPANAAFIAIFTVCVVQSMRIGRVLACRPLVALGTYSYGIYLWHELVQRAVFGGTLSNHFAGFPLFILGGALAFLVTLTLAICSWRYLEAPALAAPLPATR